MAQKVCKTPVITLGSLFSKDIPGAFILPEFPSTFDPQAKFLNNERYIIHDFPPYPDFYTEYHFPVRVCLVSGNELPILVRHKPVGKLKQHWKKWLPFLPEAETLDLTSCMRDTGDFKFITKYPLQCLPRENHAIDPDMHHRILSKNSIPEMGARCPRYMRLHDYTVPCMIKASHGTSGKGTYLAKTRKEAETIIKKIQTEMRCPEPSITEVIEDITGSYCVHFYLYKTGDIEWLGCSNEVIGSTFKWLGGSIDWNEQESLKKKLYDTVLPVKEYLYKNGYFGVVGIDVLSNKNENFVVDVNARITGTMPLLLIAPHMTELGYPFSEMLSVTKKKGNAMGLLRIFDQINGLGEGIVICLSIEEVEQDNACGQSSESCDCLIFSKSEEGIKHLYESITRQSLTEMLH